MPDRSGGIDETVCMVRTRGEELWAATMIAAHREGMAMMMTRWPSHAQFLNYLVLHPLSNIGNGLDKPFGLGKQVSSALDLEPKRRQGQHTPDRLPTDRASPSGDPHAADTFGRIRQDSFVLVNTDLPCPLQRGGRLDVVEDVPGCLLPGRTYRGQTVYPLSDCDAISIESLPGAFSSMEGDPPVDLLKQVVLAAKRGADASQSHTQSAEVAPERSGCHCQLRGLIDATLHAYPRGNGVQRLCPRCSFCLIQPLRGRMLPMVHGRNGAARA